ncbi:ATP-dependent helicase [Mycoplasma sp. P36-A1]|uniref:ATP-dependent helicase n=1 Tax=Mycoplasma sp. P36-A1 TaxID=3252900 RepID=UPI003C2DF8B4
MNLEHFNKAQQDAITSTDPYIRVIAGAGSGKTAVLTTRIAYLIQERKVKSNKILAITFTNKAATEMKDRVYDLLGDQQSDFKGVVATFHGFCLRVLKEDINMLGYPNNFNIIDPDDQKSILKDINKELEYDAETFKVKAIISYISNKKNKYNLEKLDENLERVYDIFYDKYEKYLQEHFYLDFDDLIIKVVKLFETNAVILEKWRYRFNYIMVDEFQDTNSQQYELVKMLALEQNIFVVGDPDQNIYSWRGAKIEYIMNFEKDFKNAKTIKLEYNYRSYSHILDIANDLIQNNDNRIEKKLIPTLDSEDKVIHFVADTAEQEANYVAEKINEIIANNDGVNYNDFAILYRSNYISRVFEQKLTQMNIDYKIYGGTRFYERKEIKDFISYLKVIDNEDELALTRIINVPKRKIGPKAIEKITNYARSNKIGMFEALKNNLSEIKLSKTQEKSLAEFVDIIKQQQESNEEVFSMLVNINDSVNILDEYNFQSFEYQKRADNVQELINYAQTIDLSLSDFLQSVSLDTTDEKEDSPKVSLMTMHAAKGLEYKYVFTVFLNDGVFPSSYSMERLNFEEERRLAYVAFTRAKNQLFLISHRMNQNNYTNVSSSVFVKEIDNEHLDKEGKYKQDLHLHTNVNEMEMMKKRKNNMKEKQEFNKGDKVIHPIFKKGVIIEVNDNIAKIAFEANVGIKHMNLDFIEKA